MAANDDRNWVQSLKSLGLSQRDYDNARILLAGKDSGFRQGMLGDDVESNTRVILKTLGEFKLPLGYTGLLGGHRELHKMTSAACFGLT